jgi:hypothetical protein
MPLSRPQLEKDKGVEKTNPPKNQAKSFYPNLNSARAASSKEFKFRKLPENYQAIPFNT